jgi:hypothetical protein
MNEIIAQIIIHGFWRGTLNRADMATLRLLGYTVRVMGDLDGDSFDVEVS